MSTVFYFHSEINSICRQASTMVNKDSHRLGVVTQNKNKQTAGMKKKEEECQQRVKLITQKTERKNEFLHLSIQ